MLNNLILIKKKKKYNDYQKNNFNNFFEKYLH